MPNRGHLDPRAVYYVQGRFTSAFFTRTGVAYSLRKPTPFQPASFGPSETAKVQLELLQPNPNLQIEALDPTDARVSYFRGPRDQWVTGLPTYTALRYKDVWPGIDLEFTGPDGNLKYTFYVRPGADPNLIRFAYRGASSVALTRDGSLHIDTAAGGFADDRPVAWQLDNKRQHPVRAAFSLQGEEVRFLLGTYDPSRELVIDPVVLLYAGYIGGSSVETGTDIAVDSDGNAYVTGYTASSQSTFPVLIGPDTTFNGDLDTFVVKVNPSGTALVYAGYIGGSAQEEAWGIAVDPAGNAYVFGHTQSDEATFPVVGGPDLTHNGLMDAFIAKINPAGTALVYCGYIGGANNELSHGIAVDAAGNAYVTGVTPSDENSFPVLVGPDTTFNGEWDAFVAKIGPAGTLLYAGYLGGTSFDVGLGIAADGQGHAYVTGWTGSTESSFPVKVGPDLTHNGSADAFIAKVNPSGSALVYAGFVGGSEVEFSRGIAVDGAGSVYITGDTNSTEQTFPVTVGPDATYNGGEYDGFVAKVDSTGVNLVYAGYIGGAGEEFTQSIAVDLAGNAYVTGRTDSSETSFPVRLGPFLAHKGNGDAFITKVNATGSTLVFSGYLGGTGIDTATGVAVDAAGNVYLAGITGSPQGTFPVTVGPDTTRNGPSDAFVAKLAAFPGTAGPTLAFRNAFNAIETSTFPAPGLRNASGVFRLNPVVAMSAAARAYIASRDAFTGVWLNVLNPDSTYSGWLFAGGDSPGQPALAAAGETAWIAIRDPWRAYHVRAYDPVSGFAPWTRLEGNLATDPQLAACPNGDVYVTGKDSSGALWTRRFSANLAAWQSWRSNGGIIAGVPAIACGVDNAAYIAARDSANNMWLARVEQEAANEWHYGAGIFQDDLHIAVSGNLIHVVGLSSSVPWYRTWQVGAGWLGWTSPGGVLAHLALAIYGTHLFLAGQDVAGNLWWWSGLSRSWTNFGPKNIAAGSRFSAAAR
jgi:hypothetical protein